MGCRSWESQHCVQRECLPRGLKGVSKTKKERPGYSSIYIVQTPEEGGSE